MTQTLLSAKKRGSEILVGGWGARASGMKMNAESQLTSSLIGFSCVGTWSSPLYLDYRSAIKVGWSTLEQLYTNIVCNKIVLVVI